MPRSGRRARRQTIAVEVEPWPRNRPRWARLAGRGCAVLGRGRPGRAGRQPAPWAGSQRRRPALLPPFLPAQLLLRAEHRAGGAVLRGHATRLPRRLERHACGGSAEMLAAPMPLLAVLALPILVPALLGKGRALYLLGRSVGGRRRRAAGTQGAVFQPAFLRRSARPAISSSGGCWPGISSCDRSGRTQSGDRRLTLRMERSSGPALLLLGPDGDLRLVRLADVAGPRLVQHDLRRLLLLRGDRGVPGRGDPAGHAPATRRPAHRERHRGTLPRPGKTPLCIRHLLGLYCLFAVPADLVREYSRGDRLVPGAADGRRGPASRCAVVVRPPAAAVFRAVVAGSEAPQGAPGLLGPLDARGALDRHILAGDAERFARPAAAGGGRFRLPGRPGLPVPGRGCPCGPGPGACAAGRSPAGRVLAFENS